MLRRIKRMWEVFRRPAGPTSALRRTVLNLEMLEDRSVPAANFSGSISGAVFAEPFNSAQFNSSDAVLPGVLVTLSGTTTFNETPVVVTTTTDGNGAFNFANVMPGTYEVSSGTVSGFLGSVDSTSGQFAVNPGESVTENLGINSGFDPHFISMLDFLTETTTSDFPYAPAGGGQSQAESRPDSSPEVSRAIPNQVVSVNASPTKIDLAGFFTDPDITNSEVTFNITNGGVPESLNVTLFDTTAPQTVDNFFDYINAGDYNNAIFSRLVSGFVLQGGGLQLNSTGNALTSIPLFPAIPNEFGASNTADTLAMALSSGNPNSATDQFFFNLVDNSSNLNPQDFTVFGQLADVGSDITLSNLATTSVQNESTTTTATDNPSVDLSDVPLTNYSGTSFPSDANAHNFMVINSITTDQRNETLTYSATSSNPNLVTASVQNELLTLNYAPGQVGTAQITVQATDDFGATVAQTFDVTVNPSAPTVNSVAITPNSASSVTSLMATPNGTDPENLPITYNYQWMRNGTAIPGANAPSFTLPNNIVSTDQFTVQVTPSDSLLTGSAFTSGAVKFNTINPTTIDLPSVQSVTIAPNSLTDATSLTATPSGSDPDNATLNFSYQWFRDGNIIAGATASKLTLPAGTSVNDNFTVEVTPSDGTLTGLTFTSSQATVETVSPTTFDLPTVQSVSIAQNSSTTLTATPVGTDPLGGNPNFAYQWLQNGTAISGATSQTLTIPASTAVNDKFTVEVTPSDSTFTGAMFTSKAALIQSVNPFTLEAPAIQSVTISSNNPNDATTISAAVSSTSPATFAYQWFDGTQQIPGAISSVLTLSSVPSLAANDQITVQVTPSEGTVTGPTVTSNTDTVLSTSPVITTSS